MYKSDISSPYKLGRKQWIAFRMRIFISFSPHHHHHYMVILSDDLTLILTIKSRREPKELAPVIRPEGRIIPIGCDKNRGGK